MKQKFYMLLVSVLALLVFSSAAQAENTPTVILNGEQTIDFTDKTSSTPLEEFTGAEVVVVKGEWTYNNVQALKASVGTAKATLSKIDFSDMTLSGTSVSFSGICENCTSLEKAIFPKTEITVDVNLDYTFNGCSQLATIENLQNLKSIVDLDQAFYGCSALSEVHLSSVANYVLKTFDDAKAGIKVYLYPTTEITQASELPADWQGYTSAQVVWTFGEPLVDYTLYFRNGELRIADDDEGAVYEGEGWSAEGTVLTLDGFEFTTTANTALQMPSNSTLTLAEDSKNTIETTATTGANNGILIKGSDDDIFLINGSGSLEVTAADSDGDRVRAIYAYDGSICINGANIIAKAGDAKAADSFCNGIEANRKMEIKGGANVKVSAGTATSSEGSIGINAANEEFTVENGCVVVAQGNDYAMCGYGSDGNGIPDPESIDVYASADYDGVGATKTDVTIYARSTYQVGEEDALWVQVGGELPPADVITFTWKGITEEGKKFRLDATEFDGSNVMINWGRGDNDNEEHEIGGTEITIPTYTDTNDYTVTITTTVAGVRLLELTISDKEVSALDVSGATGLVGLYCSHNKLTTLDLSQNVELTELYSDNNLLTTLTVSGAEALTTLDCSYNQLETLDVSDNTVLKDLYCNDNQLVTLDVSDNTVLKNLYCNDNKLNALDLSGNEALTSLRCEYNAIPLSDLMVASELISDPDYKRLGEQTIEQQTVYVNETFDLEGEMVLGSRQTSFGIYKEEYDDDAEENTDYVLDYENETITFLTTGNYEVTLTNEAIISRSGLPAKVKMTFKVEEGSSIPSTGETYTINLEVAEGIDLYNLTAGNLQVEENSHLSLQFLPEDRTLGADDVLFLIDGIETAFTASESGNYFSYILNPVDADHTILIALKEYPVILPEVEGIIYNVGAGTHMVPYGETFTFSLTLAEGIDPADVHVFANGIEVKANELRSTILTYTIDKVITSIEVLIEGAGDVTGNANITEGDITLSIINCQLSIINSGSAVDVAVYTVSGQNVVSLRGVLGTKTITLQSGIYLVKAGKQVFKVSVKG